MSSEELVRVLIVDDQALMRRGLARLLAGEKNIETVGASEHGRAALDFLASCSEDRLPHVVLVDIHMPVMDGITLLERLQEQYPSIRSVVLTTFEEDEFLFRGLQAGAKGYLFKDAEPEEVAEVLRRAARGESILTGAIADRLIRAAIPPRTEAAPVANPGPALLSEREHEVVGLISRGEANRGIARRLFITEGTVRNHVTNALRKLGLRDRTQLALWYASRGGEQGRPGKEPR